MMDSFTQNAPCDRCQFLTRSVVGEPFCINRQILHEGARPGAVRLSLHAARVICGSGEDFLHFEPLEAESDDERF